MFLGFMICIMAISALFDMAFIGFFCAVFYYVLTVIGAWNVFSKMGEPGWKSLIPFYNDYTVYKNVWKGSWYLIMLALSVVTGFLSSGTSGVMMFLETVLSVVVIAVEFKAMLALSRAFGHGIPYALGLYFLKPVFMIILGFNNDSFCNAVQYREV